MRHQALLERHILLDGLLLHSLDTGDGILELGAEVRGGGVVFGAVPGHLVPERLVLQDPASYGRGEFGTGQHEGEKNCQNGDPGMRGRTPVVGITRRVPRHSQLLASSSDVIQLVLAVLGPVDGMDAGVSRETDDERE